MKKALKNFTRQHKKGNNLANSTEAHELIAELNEQIAELEEAQERKNKDRDDEGTFILGSACHLSNFPHSDSPMNPLLYPTTKLTANNSACKSTQKIPLTISDWIKVPELVTPSLSRKLVWVHDIAKRVGPIIFTPRTAYIIKKGKLEATATWRNQFYEIDKKQKSKAFVLKPNRPSPTKPTRNFRILPISKWNTYLIRTLFYPLLEQTPLYQSTLHFPPLFQISFSKEKSHHPPTNNGIYSPNRWIRRRTLHDAEKRFTKEPRD